MTPRHCPAPEFSRKRSHLRRLLASLQRDGKSALGLVASLLLCVAASVACSPGTGGTGTGPITNNAPPVTPAPAPAPLPPPVTTPTTPPAVTVTTPGFNTGTGTVTTTFNPTGGEGVSATYTSSGTADSTVTALFQPNSITITVGCGTFSYAGLWLAASDGSLTVQGDFFSPNVGSQATPQIATALIRFASEGNTVSVSVTSSSGEFLLAPIVLTRSATPNALVLPAGC
jgi:hypothetical protein